MPAASSTAAPSAGARRRRTVKGSVSAAPWPHTASIALPRLDSSLPCFHRITSAVTGARKRLPARSPPIRVAIASVPDGYRPICSSPASGAPCASTVPRSRCVAGSQTHIPYTWRNRSLATPFCAQTTGSDCPATLSPRGPPRTGCQAHSASTASASWVLTARTRTSPSRSSSSPGAPIAGMRSVDVPSGVASRRPWARSASRCGPRATSTTSCPLSNSRPPMVPPTAPAPMTMYRISPILAGRPNGPPAPARCMASALPGACPAHRGQAPAGGSAAVRVGRQGVAAGNRRVEVSPCGPVPVDEGRLEHGAGRGALEGLVVHAGRAVVPADLHGRPADGVPGVAVDPHPGRVREHLVQGGPQVRADQRVPQHGGGLLEDPVVVGQVRLRDDPLLPARGHHPLLFRHRLCLLLFRLGEQQGAQRRRVGGHGVERGLGGRIVPGDGQFAGDPGSPLVGPDIAGEAVEDTRSVIVVLLFCELDITTRGPRHSGRSRAEPVQGGLRGCRPATTAWRAGAASPDRHPQPGSDRR